MSDYDIGKTAKMLQTKFADQLAGPLRELLPPPWVFWSASGVTGRSRDSVCPTTMILPLGVNVGIKQNSVAEPPNSVENSN